MRNLSRFQGKIALVTGGGRGIGKAIALGLAAEGAAVVACSRTARQLDELVKAICDQGGRAYAALCDVRRENDVQRVVEVTMATYGQLDILVNCAGVFHMGPSIDQSLEEWQTILDTNLTGTYLFCQAAAQVMLAAGQGKIINFCSLLSFVAFPERAAYAASKGGVLQLTRVLGVEWIKHGVNVNAIVPGMIQIETPHPLVEKQELTKDRIAARVPAGRVGETSDVVGPTLFLASSEADYIAGQTLVVDGGWLAYGYL